MISSRAVDRKKIVEIPHRVHSMAPVFPKSEVFRLLGGGDGKIGSKATVRKVQKWTERLIAVAEPRLIYSIESVAEVGTSYLRLKRGTVFRGHKLAKALASCDRVVCFAATMGHGIEQETERLTKRGKVSEAFVVEAIGSAGIENTVDRFQKNILTQVKTHGKGTTLRFSPGYCDWSLDEQSKLLDVVDAGLIGVTLLKSNLMIPRKSVSGLFGISPQSSEGCVQYNPCLTCGKTHCLARRSA